jgi:hypothetical protein
MQVEMNPSCQQQKLKEYCANKGICITAYSPLGGQMAFGTNPVLTSALLKEIADAKGKTIAQVHLFCSFLSPLNLHKRTSYLNHYLAFIRLVLLQINCTIVNC